MAKQVFKQYSQHQAFLLPPSLDELIEANHPVRVVSDVIDGIDLKPLYAQYKGDGTSFLSPRHASQGSSVQLPDQHL